MSRRCWCRWKIWTAKTFRSSSNWISKYLPWIQY